MSDVVIASDRADAEAAERIVEHHAELAGRVTALVRTLTRAASAGEVRSVRDRLVAWARTELLPHAEAEERSLYPAAAELAELTVLVREMVAEHRMIHRLVESLERATAPADVVAAAGGLEAVVGVHLHKENEIVLPALVASAGHCVAELAAGGHACACDHEEPGAIPEPDAR